MKSVYRDRLRRVARRLSADPFAPGAVLLSSAPEVLVSRDTSLPYRQDSDFFYLTGSSRAGLLLLIKGNCKKPFLYVRRPEASDRLWLGRASDPRSLCEALGAELKVCADPLREVSQDLRGIAHLYYQNTHGSAAWKIAQSLIETPSHLRGSCPRRFSHADCLLEAMRLHKDAHEVRQISAAIEATCRGYYAVVPLLQPGVSEKQIACCLDAAFQMRQCSPCFPTIVAAGPSAAVLHYTRFSRRLKKGEMVLIDCGAAFDMYCADMTRTFPVGGRFSSWQRDLYQIVLDAQKAAIRRIRPGVRISSVRQSAARVLTEGLLELGVLRGRLSVLLAQNASKPYFPHGIGHSLGLDVHDIGPHREQKDPCLEAGMVMTVEPGLYFPRRTAGIPACGIRLEEDVLVTGSGCRVLSAAFPRDISSIEALF